uniref:Reverse transcriptase domain-containing protein n=1 Tax=Manihot esculenta TaxID=3983 RepID=A0A2C9VYR4_MANES
MAYDIRWIEKISMCITSVSFSILQDDKEMGPIVPGRSIRQDCPLFPYIFIICAKGLSTLLRHKEA